MTICICDISALEIYRSYGRLLPDLLSAPRTSKLDGCTIPRVDVLDDTLPRLGAKTKPYHLAVGNKLTKKSTTEIARRLLLLDLPNKSLIRLNENALITCPELTFCMLATLPQFDATDLALIGFELCGTYVLDAYDNSWKGFTNTDSPITNTRKIKRMLDSLHHYPGIIKARKALGLIADNSNSPMETVQAALLGFPHTLGGLGFRPFVLNHKISTPAGVRYIDLAMPQYKVGFEYKGRCFHTPEQTGRDDRRQNTIAGCGYTIFNVWYEDLAQKHLFDNLVKDAARAMGIRLRIRNSQFSLAQKILRMKTLPSLNHYD